MRGIQPVINPAIDRQFGIIRSPILINRYTDIVDNFIIKPVSGCDFSQQSSPETGYTIRDDCSKRA